MASDSCSVLKLPPAGREHSGLQLPCAPVPLSACKLYLLSPLPSSRKPPWMNPLQLCRHCLSLLHLVPGEEEFTPASHLGPGSLVYMLPLRTPCPTGWEWGRQGLPQSLVSSIRGSQGSVLRTKTFQNPPVSLLTLDSSVSHIPPREEAGGGAQVEGRPHLSLSHLLPDLKTSWEVLFCVPPSLALGSQLLLSPFLVPWISAP